MGDKSMVPSMMTKEMLMQTMMHDKKTMAMMKKATISLESDKHAMMDESKMKMADATMVADNNELQLLIQELVARHMAAQKIAMTKKLPTDPKIMMPMMNEASMMESKNEMMAGDAMTMMMARESLIKALMKDPEVMAIVEKQVKKMRDSSMTKMLADESLMTRSESMANDPAMTKAVVKDVMVRHTMDSAKMRMGKKK